MSSRTRSETFPASGRIDLGPGNFFFILSSSANLTEVQFVRGGTYWGAENVGGGYLKVNVEEWRAAILRAPAGTTITFFYGSEEVREDNTDFRQVIASITGTVIAIPTASTFTTSKAALATATSSDIAADASRKRITIAAESDNTGSIWVRDQAATTDSGYELVPGAAVTIYNTAALRVRNNSGASQDFMTIVET